MASRLNLRRNTRVQIEVWSARLRMAASILIIDLTAITYGSLFEPESPWVIAERIHNLGFLDFMWKLIPTPILTLLVPFADRDYFRYMLPPAAAILFVLIAGSFYVMDVYSLPRFRTAFQYVFGSIFGFFYPRSEVDGGHLLDRPSGVNVLDVIGGPGTILIQPGNAAIFHPPYQDPGAVISSDYFMLPFERIGDISNLDDQHGTVNRVAAISRDGIQVAVRHVEFRYRISVTSVNGMPVQRTLQRPFPFSNNALLRKSSQLNADEEGNVNWADSVQRAITGSITTFISEHNIDYLTAPAYRAVEGFNERNKDPREALRRTLFGTGTTVRLREIGTELLWVDIGHIEIVDDEVDRQRLGLWSVEWIGNANRARAIGDATRNSLHELGRAEANAMLITAIAESLAEVEMSEDQRGNMRRILLARTAEVLESWNDRIDQRNP